MANAGLEREEKLQARLESQIRSQNTALSTQNAKLNEIGSKIKETVDKSKPLNKAFGLFKKNVADGGNSIDKLYSRVTKLASRVLVFSVITKALRGLRNGIAEIMKNDSEMMKHWNQIKFNILAIGFQLYDTIRPALKSILGILNTATQVLSYVLTNIFGKGARSVKDIAKYMKNTEKSAKETGKATASFDNLQTANSSGSGSADGSSGGIDYSSLGELKTKTTDELAKIAAISGLAMVGLGLILICTGVNIPLGLGLIVMGGLAVWSAIKQSNDGKISEDTRAMLTNIMTWAGLAMLALGLILIAVGFIPLGIALLIGGAVSLTSAVALNKNQMTNETKSFITTILAIAGAAMLVLGIILCVTGVGIPLGIALIAVGAASLIGAIALNGNAILNWIKNVWKSISDWWKKSVAPIFTKKYWSDKFQAIGDGIKSKFKSLVNWIISGLNKISFTVPDWVPALGGKKVGFNIPKLATGAVIPGGKPFMAMLGDQRAGQTNIEAPLDTIVEAFKQAQGNQNVTIKVNGNMAEFFRMLNIKIKQENNRATIWG